MTDYQEGARVEVYDADRERWCPGTVQSTWHQTAITDGPGIPLDDVIVVKSDDEFEYDLPLTWAVPAPAADRLIREVSS